MKRIYCIGFALLAWGCHSQSTSTTNNNGTATKDTAKHVQAPAKPINKGMTDTVFCTDDASQKYAVYVPANYDAHKKWPVIYFFDPHGVGNLPLILYKELADKYGYIIAGTYNSKNGMQMADSRKAAQAFMQDLWQRLSVDNNRLYTFGFSGGARVACSVALYDGGVAGVAACGGGFPERNPNFRQAFAFIGFAGERDFNYTEMKQLDKQLDQSSIMHQLIVYHGKHQWPPASEAEQAFQWFDVNAMRLHFIPRNDSIVKAIENQFDKELVKDRKQKNEVQEYFTLRKMINYIGDMVEVKADVAKLQELEKSDKVTKYLQDEQANEQQEMQAETQYINYLSDKDLNWWTDAVKQLREKIKKDSLSADALTSQRLLSYLSLATYLGASQAYKSGNDAATAHFLEIYKMVDPTNPEHSYMYAELYARENDADKAISNLQDAVKLGFTDIKRLQGDAEFNAIKEKPAFKEIIEKIKAMPPKVDMTQ